LQGLKIEWDCSAITTESTDNLPVHHTDVAPACDMGDSDGWTDDERISTPIESPVATDASNAWHFRNGLVNIPDLQPQDGHGEARLCSVLF
jgi:hypothetical protein